MAKVKTADNEAMIFIALLGIVFAVVIVRWITDETKPRQTTSLSANFSCRAANKILLNQLDAGLRKPYKLLAKSVWAVRTPLLVAGERKYVFFVSGLVLPKATLATWVVSPAVLKSGEGIIYAFDPMARYVSFYGAAIDPLGVDLDLDNLGTTLSRSCVLP